MTRIDKLFTLITAIFHEKINIAIFDNVICQNLQCCQVFLSLQFPASSKWLFG